MTDQSELAKELGDLTKQVRKVEGESSSLLVQSGHGARLASVSASPMAGSLASSSAIVEIDGVASITAIGKPRSI